MHLTVTKVVVQPSIDGYKNHEKKLFKKFLTPLASSINEILHYSNCVFWFGCPLRLSWSRISYGPSPRHGKTVTVLKERSGWRKVSRLFMMRYVFQPSARKEIRVDLSFDL